MRGYLTAVLLAVPWAAAAQDMTVDALLQDYAAYDDACRGRSPDNDLTWQACGAREYVAYVLDRQFNQCFGHDYDHGYEMAWHICEDSSYHAERPDFNE